MTTIAYRHGVLAADSCMTVNGCKLGSMVKIRRREDGALAGAAGSAGYAAAFLKWFLAKEGSPPEAKEVDRYLDKGVIFYPDGRIEVYEPGGPFEVSAPYYAFGSGSSEALGAMFAGADAVTAVQAAIEHCPHTFGEITVLNHDGIAEALGIPRLEAAE